MGAAGWVTQKPAGGRYTGKDGRAGGGHKAGKPLLVENLKTREGPWGGMKASAVLRSENDLLEMTKQLM